MAPKTIIATGNRAKRKADRQALGALSDIIVSEATKSRYQSAVATLFHWMQTENEKMPATVEDFDLFLCKYVEFLWQDGEGRSVASNTVAGIQFMKPTLRKRLVCTWRLLGAWAKREMPARAPPLTVYLVEAMAGLAMSHNEPQVATALMLGFYGLLRTGELLKLSAQDFSIGKSPRVLVINLGLTKGGARQGALESVTVDNLTVVNMVDVFCKRSSRGDKLLPKGNAHFRMTFNQLLKELCLDDWGFRPYSLRRGGATEHFRRFNSLSATTVRGRWSSAKMARIYLNDGLATLASFSFEKQKLKLKAAHSSFERRCSI